jgi:hypothetical protein
MPDKIKYTAATNTLIVGEDTPIARAGRIEQVPPAVWEYTVGGGVPVVRKWFSYRQQNRCQKKGALALDDINPTRWTAQFDDELLALLNVLGRCALLWNHARLTYSNAFAPVLLSQLRTSNAKAFSPWTAPAAGLRARPNRTVHQR